MEFSFDFKMTEENKKAIEEILKQKGIKHYVLEDKKTKEKLDLVEYKDYQKLDNELDKYKKLYQNEKDHTDTLKRIIKKIEEYVEENTEFKKSTFYGLPDYYVFKGDVKNILDLLKEIK